VTVNDAPVLEANFFQVRVLSFFFFNYWRVEWKCYDWSFFVSITWIYNRPNSQWVDLSDVLKRRVFIRFLSFFMLSDTVKITSLQDWRPIPFVLFFQKKGDRIKHNTNKEKKYDSSKKR
jgi:hypothetical protein